MKVPIALERMMFGFVESQTLFVLHHVGVFDLLDLKESMIAVQMAKELTIPFMSLERLLITAVCCGLLDKKGEEYSLKADFKPFLAKNSPDYIGNRFSHYWKTSYSLFSHLKSAVFENKPQWDKQQHPGLDPSSLGFVYDQAIYSNPTTTLEFLETMWASGYDDSVNLCAQYPLKNHKMLVDLGGATGSFVIPAVEANPQLQAIILDYPLIKPYAEDKIHFYNLQHRIRFQGGDMFSPQLPQGDVYVIAYVLSDWPESVCLSLLRTVYEHLPMGGKLLILEKLFDEDKKGPYLTAMLNTIMLLEMHGRHKTALEYEDMLKNIGFQNIKTIRSAGEKHMIVAQKK